MPFLRPSKFILNFIVEDTGIGIPEDKRDIIFERFNRLTASYSGAYPGNGLGLRMVKQFLDEIDGQSDLDTTLGKGSTFTITIPYKIPLLNPLKSKAFSNKECVNLKEPLAQAEIPPSLEAKKSNTCSSPQAAVNTLHKILLVEDHAIAAKMARHGSQPMLEYVFALYR